MPKSPDLYVILSINGDNNRLEALKLYQDAFNAKNLADNLLPDESSEIHIQMEINGHKFGIFPGDGHDARGNVCCQFEYETKEELRKAYEILSKEAQEHSIGTDFWCELFATVVDKFGIFWCLCVPN